MREEFIQTLLPLLQARQMTVKVVPPTATNDSCPFVLTYSANWHWDLVPYMREARIDVYKDGRSFGDANYLAPHGLINMSTEVYDKTEVKIERMLVRLGFPPRAPRQPS